MSSDEATPFFGNPRRSRSQSIEPEPGSPAAYMRVLEKKGLTNTGLSLTQTIMGSQIYEIPEEVKKDSSLGKKTIGYPGSLVYIINNISGPGMLALPFCLQQAGWFFPLLCLFFIWAISSLSSTMMAEAMVLIPNNHHLEERVEYATLIKHYYGKKAYWVAQVFYNLSLITLDIASILVTSQVLDLFIVFVFGKTFAIEILPSPSFHTWTSTTETPFTDEGFLVLTLGYCLSTLVFMPMGLMNLDDNIWLQFVSFGVLVTLLAEFVYEFFSLGLTPSNVPFVGNLNIVLGTVMFAFTYVVTIPSWCNEKRPHVSINRTVWGSSTISICFYITLGFLGAWAYPNQDDSNILNIMSDDPRTSTLTRYCVYIFALGVIGLGIPLFSIVVRYNLFVGEVCNKWWSMFWGAFFPYMIAWMFYQGEGFQVFLNWSSLLINGFINFVIPMMLYYSAKRVQWFLKKEKELLGNIQETSEEEDEILSSFHNKLETDTPKEKFAFHRALPKFVEDNRYILIGVVLALALYTTYLICLNIVVDLFLVFKDLF